MGFFPILGPAGPRLGPVRHYRDCPVLLAARAHRKRAERVYAATASCFDEALVGSLRLYSIAVWTGHLGYLGGFGQESACRAYRRRPVGTCPKIRFFAFQMPFAIFTPALDRRRLCLNASAWFWDLFFGPVDCCCAIAPVCTGFGRWLFCGWLVSLARSACAILQWHRRSMRQRSCRVSGPLPFPSAQFEPNTAALNPGL